MLDILVHVGFENKSSSGILRVKRMMQFFLKNVSFMRFQKKKKKRLCEFSTHTEVYLKI